MPNLIRHNLIIRALQHKADFRRLPPLIQIAEGRSLEPDLAQAYAVGRQKRLQLAQQSGFSAA